MSALILLLVPLSLSVPVYFSVFLGCKPSPYFRSESGLSFAETKEVMAYWFHRGNSPPVNAHGAEKGSAAMKMTNQAIQHWGASFLCLSVVPVLMAVTAGAEGDTKSFYIPVGMVWGVNEGGAISFRDYDFSADAYLKCAVVQLEGVKDIPPSLDSTSLSVVRAYAAALEKRDYDGQLNACYPASVFQKERTEKKNLYKQTLDFWSARFKSGLPITISYGLLCGESIFYLMTQRETGAPGELNHIEVVETKPCSLNEWRCAVGEFSNGKNMVIASLFGCAANTPKQKLDGGKKYAEIPVIEGKGGKGNVALVVPTEQNVANAEIVKAGCAASNRLAAWMERIGDKGKVEDADISELKGLCSPDSFKTLNMYMDGMKRMGTDKNPAMFKGSWDMYAGMYRVGKDKCIAVPAGKAVILWVMNDLRTLRQITVKKETDTYIVCEIGGERNGLADFWGDSKVEESVSAFIENSGITFTP